MLSEFRVHRRVLKKVKWCEGLPFLPSSSLARAPSLVKYVGYNSCSHPDPVCTKIKRWSCLLILPMRMSCWTSCSHECWWRFDPDKAKKLNKKVTIKLGRKETNKFLLFFASDVTNWKKYTTGLSFGFLSRGLGSTQLKQICNFVLRTW